MILAQPRLDLLFGDAMVSVDCSQPPDGDHLPKLLLEQLLSELQREAHLLSEGSSGDHPRYLTICNLVQASVSTTAPFQVL
jgi:hypothetical protein